MLNRVILAASMALILFAAVAPAYASEGTTPGDGAKAGSTAGEHEEGIDPLAFKGDLAVWTAVVFLVLLLILWKFAWGPLAAGLDSREKAVADQIAQAEKANADAKQLLAQYEQKLSDAQGEVRAMLDKARRDAEQLGRDMLEKSKADARAEQQRAMRQIEAATNSALKELADRGAKLAVELAGKIVRAKLNPKDHAKLIDQAVAGFSKNPPSNN
jgi:F-type H+-transporting ATPase subunit b